MLLLRIEKKESKTLETFQKLLEWISQTLSTIRAGNAKAVEEMFMRELTKN